MESYSAIHVAGSGKPVPQRYAGPGSHGSRLREQLTGLHRCLASEFFHGAYDLFPVALPVTIAEHPNIWTGFPFLAVQTTALGIRLLIRPPVGFEQAGSGPMNVARAMPKVHWHDSGSICRCGSVAAPAPGHTLDGLGMHLEEVGRLSII